MDNPAVIGWFIITILLICLIVLLFWRKGLVTILSIIFWIYILFLIVYCCYANWIFQQPDPNIENRFNVAFENLGNWFEYRVIPEADVSFQVDHKDQDTINRYRTGYKLGYRLELGEPSQKWINEATVKLQSMGEEPYYKELRQNNINRIRSLVTPGITLHDVDVQMTSVFNYNSFDVIESMQDTHLFVYSRPEWDWITKNKICPWTKNAISDIVLKTIKNRKKIASILDDVFTYPLQDEGEGRAEVRELVPKSQILNEMKAERSEISESRSSSIVSESINDERPEGYVGDRYQPSLHASLSVQINNEIYPVNIEEKYNQKDNQSDDQKRDVEIQALEVKKDIKDEIREKRLKALTRKADEPIVEDTRSEVVKNFPDVKNNHLIDLLSGQA